MRPDSSDADWRDWRDGPYTGEPNCVCPKCKTEFHKDPRDTGDLCEPCAYSAWVDRQEREWREAQVTRGLRRMVNE